MNASEDKPYKKAPIAEALISIYVDGGSELDADTLVNLNSRFTDEYSVTEELQSKKTIREDLSRDFATGCKFFTDDGQKSYFVHPNSFSFSQLFPYKNWDAFSSEARRLWLNYRTVRQPEEISKISVRYLNRIEVPHTEFELNDYFRYSLSLPSAFPQDYHNFFLQVSLDLDAINGVASITLTPIGERDGVTPIILDIELTSYEDIPLEEDKLWEFFGVLREEKNKIFEAVITDKTRSLFK